MTAQMTDAWSARRRAKTEWARRQYEIVGRGDGCHVYRNGSLLSLRPVERGRAEAEVDCRARDESLTGVFDVVDRLVVGITGVVISLAVAVSLIASVLVVGVLLRAIASFVTG